MTDKQMNINQCPYEGECQICKIACSVDTYCSIKQLFDERNEAEKQLQRIKRYRQQELEYIRVGLVCLLGNANTSKQADKINRLIKQIAEWQHFEE